MDLSTLLAWTLALAYGPFCVMLGAYLAALALRSIGRPGLLCWLIERTKVPEAPSRGH